MIKKVVLPLLFLIPVFGFQATAQDTNQLKSKVAITVLPLYTFEHALRVDFDINIKKNNWLVIGPHYFTGKESSYELFMDLPNEGDLTGYGVDLLHKIFLSGTKLNSGAYTAYGFRYNFFQIDYQKDYSSSIIETEKVNQYGVNFLFGYQFVISNRVIIDFYSGVGIQEASITTTSTSKDYRSDGGSFLYFGNSGPRMLLGVRFGTFF
jgi:hypothetical protein